MNKPWLKKIGGLGVIFLLIFLFSLNKSRVYQSETKVLLLPKNEITTKGQDLIAGNFRQVLMSLAFSDRIADGNDALEASSELPNYKRKEFWDSKISVTQLEKSGIISIKNFDQNSTLAKELNNDTVENLIAVSGNYYNIKTELELRVVDGPIVKRIISRNLFLTITQSILWALGIFVVIFFLFPFVFIKREPGRRGIPGRDFSPRVAPLKKTVPAIIPEEENYFATKNFFETVKKPEEVKVVSPQKNVFSLPTMPSFGKKAPTPANLPVSEEEMPDIFRQKEVIVEKKPEIPVEKAIQIEKEYIPREATPEEVKARLNRLLGGGK
ncbi:MAG: hypothetical protein WAV73_01705 [Candidatus Moraniibacteriota bacterium]